MRTTAKMGLTSWDQPTDPYNYAQLAGNWQILDYHDHSPGRGMPVAAGGLAPGAVLSNSIAAGVVGLQHLSTQMVQDLGLNANGSVGRGYFAKAGADTTTSATFTSLSTPDQLTGLTLTVGGYFIVDYHALWKTSNVADAGSVDIFLTPQGGSATEVLSGNTGLAVPATTTSTSLVSIFTANGAISSGSTTWAGDFTTGVSMGSSMRIYAAAGTYTVGVRFLVAGGATLTVQNRQLWARAVNFT